MKYYFTDLPRYYPVSDYHAAIETMKNRLMASEKVIAVYQIGGVNSPGISDIDLYVVFRDQAQYTDNPVKDCGIPDNYFFIHNLFGCCESFATRLEQYTYFRKYDLIAGTDVGMLNYHTSAEEETVLKAQIALEYLIKAWFSISLGTQSGIVKLRSLLLHAKALVYDLEFLNLSEHPFQKVLNEVMELRSNWFNSKSSDHYLSSLVDRYEQGLASVVQEGIEKHQVFITPEGNTRISNKAYVHSSGSYTIQRSGVRVPSYLMNKSSRWMKINNRLNSYKIHIPFKTENIPAVIRKRSDTFADAIRYNKSNLPHFICTAYGTNLFSN